MIWVRNHKQQLMLEHRYTWQLKFSTDRSTLKRQIFGLWELLYMSLQHYKRRILLIIWTHWRLKSDKVYVNLYQHTTHKILDRLLIVCLWWSLSRGLVVPKCCSTRKLSEYLVILHPKCHCSQFKHKNLSRIFSKLHQLRHIPQSTPKHHTCRHLKSAWRPAKEC